MESTYLKLCCLCNKLCNRVTKADEHVKELRKISVKSVTSPTTTLHPHSSSKNSVSPIGTPTLVTQNTSSNPFNFNPEIMMYHPEGTPEPELPKIETLGVIDDIKEEYNNVSDIDANIQIENDKLIAKEWNENIKDVDKITSGEMPINNIITKGGNNGSEIRSNPIENNLRISHALNFNEPTKETVTIGGESDDTDDEIEL